MKLIFNLVKTTIIILLGAILLFNSYSLYQKQVKKSQFPMVFGYGYALVASGSMDPTLSWGDLVVIHKEKVYDDTQIITFLQEGDSRPTTHRIVSQDEQSVVTKGDANNTEDSPIVREQIFGRVSLILPFVGYLVTFMGSPLGIILIIGLFFVASYKERRHAEQK